jgi:hypothetical protein
MTVGEQPPALSIAWQRPTSAVDSGFSVIFSDYDPDEESDEGVEAVCLHCLVQGGDEQVGRGLDLARQHGQVDWDPDAGEWRVPDAWERVHGLRPRGES